MSSRTGRPAAWPRGVALFLAAAAAVAQGPATVRADDPVVVRIAGPERIRDAFLATNVSAVLAAREVTDFWELLGAALRDDAQRLRADAGVVDALVERLDGYAGTATIALVPHRMAGMRLWADGLLVLEPDGRTDLATIARDVRRLLAAAAWRPQDRELGGTMFPVVAVGPARIGLPTMIDDRLVVLFGRDLEEFVATRLDDGAAPFVPDAELLAAPISMRVDLRALVERRVLLVPPFVTPGPDSAYARRTGLASLRELRATIRSFGPHVGLDVAVSFGAGVDRGGLGVLLGQGTGQVDRIGPAPTGVAGWYAGRLDAAALFDAALRSAVAGRLGREAPDRVARNREEIDELLGVRLEQDVLARLDGAFVVLEAAPEPGASRDESALLVLARVRDGGPSEASLSAVARWWWGRVDAVEPSGEDEPRIQRAGDAAFCVHAGVLALAIGPDPVQALRRHGTLRGAGVGWPPAVARRQPQAPPGIVGCGAMDVRRVLAPGALRRLGRVLPLPDELAGGWAEAIGALEPHLAPFEADRAALFTAWDGDVWRFRLLW